MAKYVFLLIAFVCLFAALVECDLRQEDAQMKQVLEEHAKSIGLGLAGRLASGSPGLVGSKVFPSFHEQVGGKQPCRFGNC